MSGLNFQQAYQRRVQRLSIMALGAIVTLGGCTTTPTTTSEAEPSEAATEDALQVVTTFLPITQFTKAVVGDRAEVVQLLPTNVGPNDFQARPSDVQTVSSADVLVKNGLEMEFFLDDMIENAENSDLVTIDSSEEITALASGEEGHDDHAEEKDHDDHGEDHDHHAEAGHDDHGEEDHHDEHDHDEHGHEDHHDEHDYGEEEGEPDPHVWHDAENGIAMVRVIEAELSEVFPENADLYEANAEALITQLTQLDTWIQQQIDTVPESQRVLVSTHDALGYYADAYGIRIEAALASFSTEARPSAADLRELIDLVEDSGLPSIFVEATSNPRLIEAVSRETDIGISEEPIYADGLGEPGTPAATYTGMLMTNTCTIVTGLGGSCNEAAVQAFLD